MLLNGANLTYCMNIHPSETWDETINAINKYASVVKNIICPDRPYGLGLRLSNQASIELEPQVLKFKEYLASKEMYVATINGFPYGQFHGCSVKKNAYLPDWSQSERVTYTKRLGRILAEYLPEGMVGSISSVPICYGKKMPDGAIENILETAKEFARIEAELGKTIVLCLEPEPDCYLESTNDVLDLWEIFRSKEENYLCDFIGICFDVCHMSCGFEDLLESLRKMNVADIQVPKIQVSSILRVLPEYNAQALLAPFLDREYLHQTRVLSQGNIICFPDLDIALNENPLGEWRVHFHVPLNFKGSNGLSTTASEINKKFIKEIFSPGRHVEIETYSFNVIPDQKEDVIESICTDLKLVLKLGGHPIVLLSNKK